MHHGHHGTFKTCMTNLAISQTQTFLQLISPGKVRRVGEVYRKKKSPLPISKRESVMLICDHKSALFCVHGKRQPCGALCSHSVMRFRICQTCFSCAAASSRMRTQMGLEHVVDKLVLLQYKAHLCTQIQQHKLSFEYGMGAFFILIKCTGMSPDDAKAKYIAKVEELMAKE
ncbi:unnamed protein product [Amoebophrya sp. A120]|nr:unnamed protein product [Amoebophrya sp. A120]|eukprot:GSA120T00000547001.1